ncbi:GntR family transcriptional regulator [Promicromonospora sp. NPDC057488]|uniref:GntR family transcriptional regulator n=1 Tax=Promicromonospora sp. NPDC057488 TaxID=3346147 RepID=UPI00366C0CBC
MLPAVVRPSVQDAIRRDIIAGVLTPGARVTEASLAQRYDVSRVPVREALRGLASEGFIDSRPHVGSRVAPIPVHDADDLFAVREALEVATARSAARRAAALYSGDESPEDWWRIRRQIAALLDAGDAHVAEGDLDPLVGINDEIHIAVAELSGSATLTQLLRQLSWKIEWLYAADMQSRGKRLWPDHRVIVGAIDAGDGERAAALMAAHVRESRIGYLRRYGVTRPSSDPEVAAAVRRQAGGAPDAALPGADTVGP